jgi:hypothetical protein
MYTGMFVEESMLSKSGLECIINFNIDSSTLWPNDKIERLFPDEMTGTLSHRRQLIYNRKCPLTAVLITPAESPRREPPIVTFVSKGDCQESLTNPTL